MFWKKKKKGNVVHIEQEDDFELKPRDSTATSQRVLALLAVIGRAHEDPPERVTSWVRENNIAKYFSSEESEYFFKAEITLQGKQNFSWRAESVVSLIWALGGLEEFPNLDEQFDIYATELVAGAINDPAKFLLNAKLRPFEEIEEKESDMHHQHWRVRDAQLFQKTMPDELDPGIVYERRYALSWLVGYGECWDDVPTDT